MNVEQCRRAVEIADAIKRLNRLRKIVEGAGEWKLEFCATDGDEEGGTLKGTTILPDGFTAAAFEPLEVAMKAELDRLGVEQTAAVELDRKASIDPTRSKLDYPS